MEINNLSNTSASQPPESRSGDLLARLQAAGTLEAEVVRNIEGKLLISTRLGDLLTSNSLNFKPGDKLMLRLEGSAQSPVLKASPRIPGLITIESTRHPDLNRLLSPAKSLLAVVTRVDAQQTIIRLAGQSMTLPRLEGVKQGQLLNLQQDPRGRLIEIAPLERRLIYQALLKQLVPRQAGLKPLGLVKLLNLVSGATNDTPPAVIAKSPARNAAGSLPPGEPQATQAQSGAGNRSTADRLLSGTNRAGTIPAATVPAGPATTRAAGSEKARPDSAAAPTPVAHANQPKTSSDRPEINAILRHINRVATNNASVIKPTSGTTASAGASPGAREASLPPGAVNSSKNTMIPGTASDSASASLKNAGTAHAMLSGNTVSTGPTGAGGQSTGGVAAAPSAATTLQGLLLLVPGIANADSSRIRQWFEFAQLVRHPQTEMGAALPGNALQLLRQMAEPEAFRRELGQFMRGKTQGNQVSDSATLKSSVDEPLVHNIREGLKLLDQSLSQNLLQRVSLGLQQESQLPLSLLFAVPILEQQAIKALTIELDQRDQSGDAGESSWDIRLNFEFDELGAVASHIFLEGNNIAVSFYAEQSHAHDRIEQALPLLQQQLASAGFNARELHSFSGLPRTDNGQGTGQYSDALVDIEV